MNLESIDLESSINKLSDIMSKISGSFSSSKSLTNFVIQNEKEKEKEKLTIYPFSLLSKKETSIEANDSKLETDLKKEMNNQENLFGSGESEAFYGSGEQEIIKTDNKKACCHFSLLYPNPLESCNHLTDGNCQAHSPGLVFLLDISINSLV